MPVGCLPTAQELPTYTTNVDDKLCIDEGCMSFDLKQIENLILDMDGVLWRGETPMPGLTAFFDTLNEMKLGYVLATNNATKVATQYREKLKGLGVDVPAEHILTSAEATAAYLRHRYPAGTSAYVLGEEGLRHAMRQKEFQLLSADGFVGADAQAELVVVGFTRHACYDQLASAAQLVRRGARFVGTNPDVTFPSEVGPLPGAGSLLAFIEAATAVEPLVVGKPSPAIFQEALDRLGASPETTAMVGDRLETDIKGAQTAGLHTVLLLSGVTDREKAAQSDIHPDLVCDDVTELTRLLRER